ncbi:alpha/beta-hydrolase [Xylariaceae sp. FL0255]|nr:alpha/beta-hydrolase [Xylariaceae sp. FL0255]
MTAPQNAESKALVQPPMGFLTALKYRIHGYLFNRFAHYGLGYLYSQDKEFWAARSPTEVKYYPVRPKLQVRLFSPKKASDDENAKYPVFFLFHGGGWTIGNAQMDDEQSHLLADKYGFYVASVEYGLGPGNRFPGPMKDCMALMKAVMADISLPLDLDRVVVGGFSAGAVMTLGLAQQAELKNVIKALVAFYPLTDWTGEHRAAPTVSAWGQADTLHDNMPMFAWTYVPEGSDLRNPVLSPFFASRKDIPQPLFMITASGDFLYLEAQIMACQLAGVDEHSEMYGSDSWEQNGVRYRRVKDMMHTFTHCFEKIKDPEWEAKRLKANEDIWQEVNDWTKKVLV